MTKIWTINLTCCRC